MGMIKKLFGLEEEIRTPKQEDVIPARCTVTSEDFDITLGYEKGKYAMLSGVRTATVPSHSAPTVQSSGLKTLDLSNGLIAGRTYHCPICGNKDIVRCGKCHRIIKAEFCLEIVLHQRERPHIMALIQNEQRHHKIIPASQRIHDNDCRYHRLD